MNKNLTINMGNCNHRKYIPMLVDMVESGSIDPQEILTQQEPMMSAIEAYKAFDRRQPGWVKVGTNTWEMKAITCIKHR